MPPRSPLPQRNGLDPAWVRTPNRIRDIPDAWQTMGQWLRAKLPSQANPDHMLASRRFVREDGSVVLDADPYRPHTFVWFHRDLREEPEVPGVLEVIHHSDRLVVVDKPPFLASIPRGRHVMQSVVVRLRAELGLPQLTPIHRLDRVTSGLLALTTEQRWRGPYQELFQHRQVDKVYRALARLDPGLTFPLNIENHIHKTRGTMHAEIIVDATPNALTHVELESTISHEEGIYRLEPATGRTHQLRVHMNSIGLPISGDPLYPEEQDIDVDGFSTPLQLIASELAFTDPIDAQVRHFVSRRSLPLKSEAPQLSVD